MRKFYTLCALAAAMLTTPAANAFTIDEICGNYSINLTIGTPAYTISGFSSTTSGTMTIEKGSAANEITIKNFAPNQPDLTATFDESTNTVTIQPVIWISNATIGSYSGYNFYICTGEITQDGGYNVVTDRKAVTGTFDADKNITFANWMLVDDYYDEPMSYDITSVYTPKDEEEQPEEPGHGFALEEILGDYNTDITAAQAFDILTSYDESNSAWSQFSQTSGTMTIEKGDSDNAIILKGFVANQPDINATYNAATGTITIQATSNWPISNYVLCKEITGYDSDDYFVITSREAFTGKFDADKKLTFEPWAVCNNTYSDVVVYQTASVFTPANAAIEGITADEADINAPVEFYNMQGVRVNAENLGTGIYIRRQGSKATKIMVTK